MLNGHGDDLHLIDGEIKYNFSSNVYYKGCSPLLFDSLKRNIEFIQNYPSPTANELSALAAKKHQLSENQFLFTNGATEAFYLIAQLFSGESATIVGPTFSEYEDACKIFNVNYQLISRENLDNINTGAVFICNPNNPDGKVFVADELGALFIQYPNTVFVIDEAYIEFTNNIRSVVPFTKDHSNLMVVRSLTKTFAIPGLRLGYIVSDKLNIERLLSLKMPWSVNALAIEAGKFIFNNYEKLQFDAVDLLSETKNLQQELDKIEGIKVCATNTSYFLIQLHHKPAKELKDFLIKTHRILVRDATNFNKLDGDFIRISTQSKEANQYFVRALKEWI